MFRQNKYLWTCKKPVLLKQERWALLRQEEGLCLRRSSATALVRSSLARRSVIRTVRPTRRKTVYFETLKVSFALP